MSQNELLNQDPMLTAILSGVVQGVITEYVQECNQGDDRIIIADNQVAELSGRLVEKAQMLLSSHMG